MNTRFILLLYVVFTILNLSSEFFLIDWLRYISKPMLMIVLAIYFWISVQSRQKYDKLMLAALFFSWGGDVFLMIPRDLFVFGLASFLIAHVLYIVAFGQEAGWWKNIPLMTSLTRAVILLFFGAMMFGWIQKGLGELFVPVLVYMSVILVMGFAAWSRKEVENGSNSWLLGFLGALTFIVSDSCIAISKFVTAFEGYRLVIMFTYILAQYLIIQAAITRKPNN